GMMRALKSGQRLVTLDGALWRWDGFVAAADAPSAAAQRLAQRNRLAELDEEVLRAKGERNAWKRDVEALSSALESARQAERARRDEWRRAQHAIGTAQAEVDTAQRAVGALARRRSTLDDAQTRLAADLAEAEAMHEEALALQEEAGDESEIADAADEAQQHLS